MGAGEGGGHNAGVAAADLTVVVTPRWIWRDELGAGRVEAVFSERRLVSPTALGVVEQLRLEPTLLDYGAWAG